MYSLWFKQCYVNDILSGAKSSTYRLKRPRFADGDVVSASVGPRLSFALLRVDSISEVDLTSLSTAKHNELAALYDLSNIELLYHIEFSIQQTPTM